MSLDGADLNGNTTGSFISGSTLVRADASTDITFETAYGSVGATSAEYDVDIYVEKLP